MAYVICNRCIKDKKCLEVCPVNCIYETEKQMYIHPEECIDCGACVSVCPVNAIFSEKEIPKEWFVAIEQNRQWAGLS